MHISCFFTVDIEHETCIMKISRARNVHDEKQKKGREHMSVGKKLRELRGERTQDDISKKLGITKSAYAMYEQDKRIPRDEIKVRISNLFGVSVQDLFYA